MAIIILTTLNSYKPYLLPIVNVLEKIVDRQVVEFLVTIVRFLPCHGAVCILRSLSSSKSWHLRVI